MAWIESHQELAQHPKTKRLARQLNVSLPTAIGHLHMLWWWALDYADDGDLSKYELDDIADALLWNDPADLLVNALVTAGFLDRDDETLTIHDWGEYAGRLVNQRNHARQQKRRHRELYNNKALILAIRDRDRDKCRYCGRTVDWKDRKGAAGATYDYIDPNGETSLDNLVVACRACSAGKNQRTPAESGYTLLPPSIDNEQKSIVISQQSNPDLDQHNITEHNRTKPKYNTLPKKQFAEFVTMTDEEHKKLVERYSKDATARMIEVLDNYKGANGKRYKSDYRAILNWVADRVAQENVMRSPPGQGVDRQLNQPRREVIV